MIKINITFSILFIILLIISTGCDLIIKKDNASETDEVTGTKGLTMEFVKNFPQDEYILSGGDKEGIEIVLDVRNEGAFTPSTDNFLDINIENIDGATDEQGFGNIFLGGFDDKIIISDDDIKGMDKTQSLGNLFLPGKSSINPRGGIDTISFNGKIITANVHIDQYEPTILATMCYSYLTEAGPSVCIDFNPYDTREDKVCNIESKSFSSQGAPIAVTKIVQEATKNKIRFKITIENVGSGDTINFKSLDKCIPSPDKGLDREDFDFVELLSVTVGTNELFIPTKNSESSLILSKCGPFAKENSNLIRLFNGEGFVICTLDKEDFSNVQSAYTTPLNIILRYGYRETISKKIKITKLKGFD